MEIDQRCLKAWPHGRIWLQRFAQLARGRIGRGGPDSVILDTKFHLRMARKAIYFEKGLPLAFV